MVAQIGPVGPSASVSDGADFQDSYKFYSQRARATSMLSTKSIPLTNDADLERYHALMLDLENSQQHPTDWSQKDLGLSSRRPSSTFYTTFAQGAANFAKRDSISEINEGTASGRIMQVSEPSSKSLFGRIMALLAKFWLSCKRIFRAIFCCGASQEKGATCEKIIARWPHILEEESFLHLADASEAYRNKELDKQSYALVVSEAARRTCETLLHPYHLQKAHMRLEQNTMLLHSKLCLMIKMLDFSMVRSTLDRETGLSQRQSLEEGYRGLAKQYHQLGKTPESTMHLYAQANRLQERLENMQEACRNTGGQWPEQESEWCIELCYDIALDALRLHLASTFTNLSCHAFDLGAVHELAKKTGDSTNAAPKLVWGDGARILMHSGLFAQYLGEANDSKFQLFSKKLLQSYAK